RLSAGLPTATTVAAFRQGRASSSSSERGRAVGVPGIRASRSFPALLRSPTDGCCLDESADLLGQLVDRRGGFTHCLLARGEVDGLPLVNRANELVEVDARHADFIGCSGYRLVLDGKQSRCIQEARAQRAE